MSGKVYTMKEMKGIVTYLTEHKAYGEIRGRKMWVDFANSNFTNRSWQSLKETFLKRILPDIHNPYYNLTREQIISFRQGYDVDERAKNKLEFETVAEIHNNNMDDALKGDDEAVQQGENDTSSNIISKDISEQNNCYKTVDEIIKDLESPNVEKEKHKNSSKLETKSSVVKNVLKDFASDPDESEERFPDKSLESAESVEIQEEQEAASSHNTKSDEATPHSIDDVQHLDSDVVEIKSEKDNSIQELTQPKDSENNIEETENANIAETETPTEKIVVEEKSHDILDISSPNKNDMDVTTNNKNENQSVVVASMISSCQPLTNSNSETILPNNQEGLKAETCNKSKSDSIEVSKKNNTKALKRSSSAETVLLENKRQRRTTTDKKCQPDGPINDDIIFEVNDSDNVKTKDGDAKAEKATRCDDKPTNDDVEEPPSQNPCLKSVSLYAEQFNKTKYSVSSSDENAIKEMDPKPSGSKEVKKVPKEPVKEDIVVLKSHSESESDEPQVKRPRAFNRVGQARRDKALANIFGFSSGAVSGRHRKTSQNQNRRSRAIPQVNDDSDSDSSKWTTDTEQDNFVSPPRGRKNRKTRKYLKPKSARILSLEEEGGLFVMYGKRVYPIVKDGRILKNFVIYESNSDSGFEQDSYWKAKYAELKKKYEKNKKSKEPSVRPQETKEGSAPREPSSPILQSSVRKNQQVAQACDVPAPSTSNTKPVPVPDSKEVVTSLPVENKMTSEKIMIKYTVNNAEVQLEGHWPQICPIFDKVLDVLPRKTDPVTEARKESIKLDAQQTLKTNSSRESTPVIITSDSVHDKIDKLESEIFKEIEEKDKEEQLIKQEHDSEQNVTETYDNVTNRKRGRPTKQSRGSDFSKSPHKLLKPVKIEQQAVTTAKQTLEPVKKSADTTPSTPRMSTRRTRRSMKVDNVMQKEEETNSAHESPEQSNLNENSVRYMLTRTSQLTNSNKRKSKRY